MTTAGTITYVLRMLLEIDRLVLRSSNTCEDAAEIRELAANSIHAGRAALLELHAGSVCNSNACRHCGLGIRLTSYSFEPQEAAWVHVANDQTACLSGSELRFAEPDRRAADHGSPTGFERRNRIDDAIADVVAAVDRVLGPETSSSGVAPSGAGGAL
ncbi:hypothetical protein Acid345_3191 [Candidatus Koribacter versatilis Ellin345]|uniref:Uncharacterized protein n=1 Tax=Koribacter versatilis (strain Ellin345) TaxID=204669 RepID=Q1ILQ8_KORVE|nr:hypothetical protein [Candidatus Koribacter versatilis]ABF42192.1 hypothetical protein Acid345_3191 [Candidatus Koribacter versatilis Ellin345]